MCVWVSVSEQEHTHTYTHNTYTMKEKERNRHKAQKTDCLWVVSTSSLHKNNPNFGGDANMSKFKKKYLQHCLQRRVAIYLTVDQQSSRTCGLGASRGAAKSRADEAGKHACPLPSHFSLLAALTLHLLSISQLVIRKWQVHAMDGEVERLREARALLSSRFAKPALDYLPPYFSYMRKIKLLLSW